METAALYLKRELPKLLENNIRLFAVGRIHDLPQQVQDELLAGVEATSRNTGLRVNLAINYGGRAELVDAMNQILQLARRDGVHRES